MNKRALVIGIDDYRQHPLYGCVKDATDVASALGKNGDGSPNFEVRLLISREEPVNARDMLNSVTELFRADADTVLFYFAGHGLFNPDTNAGYLVSQDGARGAWGLALSDLLTLANNAYPRIRSTVVILDSCHSGFAGEAQSLGSGQLSVIGTGLTILTACHRDGTATEASGRGVFTDIVLEGMAGSAADVLGRVTPAAIYALVDQTLGAWDQRPIYKANVQSFITLREVAPKIPRQILRNLMTYFPHASNTFPLDPTYEPDRQNIPIEFRQLPVDPDKVRVFKELQLCNRHGLIVPVDAEHMYYAAIESKGCRLTALGAHYRNLAALGRI